MAIHSITSLNVPVNMKNYNKFSFAKKREEKKTIFHEKFVDIDNSPFQCGSTTHANHRVQLLSEILELIDAVDQYTSQSARYVMVNTHEYHTKHAHTEKKMVRV